MSKSRLATNIDSKLLHELKIRSAIEDVKLNVILEKIIKDYLKQNKKDHL